MSKQNGAGTKHSLHWNVFLGCISELLVSRDEEVGELLSLPPPGLLFCTEFLLPNLGLSWWNFCKLWVTSASKNLLFVAIHAPVCQLQKCNKFFFSPQSLIVPCANKWERKSLSVVALLLCSTIRGMGRENKKQTHPSLWQTFKLNSADFLLSLFPIHAHFTHTHRIAYEKQMLPWFCSWKRRGALACSGGESMAARRSRKVETAYVSADRKKRPLKSGHR